MMQLPPDAAARASRIEALLDEAERVLAQGGAVDEASFSLRETRARYLPDTLRAYFDVPPSLRGERDASGRTPDELLIAQLDHLERATAQRLRELAARRKTWKPKAPSFGSGALWRFAKNVGPARQGAVTNPGAAAELRCYADI